MNTPRQPAPKAKLPKARVVAPFYTSCKHYYRAEIPCDNRTEARQRVRFERMGWEEKVSFIADAHARKEGHGFACYPRHFEGARAVLLALGHRPTGGSQK